MVCPPAKPVKLEDAVSEVTCAACGFLAIRHRWNRSLIEAEPDFRRCAAIPRSHGSIEEHERIPVCFAGALEFSTLITRDDASGILPVIQKPRNCDSFTAWKHGFTPKEHQEMLDREWLLKFQTEREDADRRWRQECDERDKAWRERQDKDEHAWRERQAATEERRHRVNLIVMGLLTIIAGLVGAAIQADWIPNFFSWLTGTST